MAPRRKSRAEAEMEEQLQRLDPTSERYAILAAARDFKAAWVEFGEALTKARENRVFQQWGYSSFEAYCRRELKIKSDTANKLTRSFSFLRDHVGGVLEQRSERDLPPLEVVDLLSQARQKSKITEPQLESIQGEVFDQDSAPITRAQLVKRIREIDPDAFRSADKPKNADAPVDGELRRAMILAERLQAIVENMAGITNQARDGLQVLVGELHQRVESAKAAASEEGCDESEQQALVESA